MMKIFENIEMLNDELGCPVEIIIEALKEGIIVETKEKFDLDKKHKEEYDFNGYIHSNIVADEDISLLYYAPRKYWYIGLLCKEYLYNYNLTDYKKTWWLPKDFNAKLINGIWKW